LLVARLAIDEIFFHLETLAHGLYSPISFAFGANENFGHVVELFRAFPSSALVVIHKSPPSIV
jgi:hypothetical protein